MLNCHDSIVSSIFKNGTTIKRIDDYLLYVEMEGFLGEKINYYNIFS